MIPPARGVLKVYDKALQNITKEVNKIFELYSKNTGLDVSELSRVIYGAEKEEFLFNVRNKMQLMGMDLEEVYIPFYLDRLTRLEAFKQQIYWEIASIAPQETTITGKAYASLINHSYNQLTADFDDLGITSAFNRIDNQTIKQIMRDSWQGENWSLRIWKNTATLADELPQIIGGRLMSGQSLQKSIPDILPFLSKEIRENFKFAKYAAMRLLRTESNYFSNQAEAEASQNTGLDRYEFYAILDGRTSVICRQHDGNVYKYSEMVVGVNYPPLHPNCRSSAMPLLEGELHYERLRPMLQTRLNEDGTVKESNEMPFDLQGFYKPKPPKLDFITARVGRDVHYFPVGSTAEDISKELGDDWSSIFVKNKKAEMKKEWQKAMDKQMTITKDGQRDYSAEMNIITRKYQGEELRSKVKELLDRIPIDDPKRESVKTIAREMYGIDSAKIEDKKYFTDDIHQEKLSSLSIRLDDQQQSLVDNFGIKFKAMAGEDAGDFDSLANEIGINASYYSAAKNAGIFRQKDLDSTVNHEIGHGYDHILGGFDFSGLMSDSAEFRSLMTQDTQRYIVDTRHGNVDDKEYYASSSELFASGYAEYKANPENMKEFNLNLFNYYEKINNRRF